jgi:2-polyprenyl-3-methyl-5-hydroxy-6-metoxy-1,4-benzoquinol methylase
MVEKLLPYAKDGDWLDIGFGNASLLFTAQEYGFGVVGIDLRSDNVTALAQFGIESHCVHIADFDQTGRFSVISMADVLEHMPYPNNGLKEVHRLLKPGGLLFLSMPNKDCMPWEILDAQQANPYWWEIEHYHNFGRKRLYKLLEDQGFEPVRYGISERYRVCMEVIARKL